MERDDLKNRVLSLNWYHRFELLPGIFTTGQVEFDAGALLDSAGIASNLAGKRAIDIGAWDGPMSFELERRGARTVALDVLDPDQTGFNFAHRLLGSRVEYVRGSVYDLPELFSEPFDLICFLGVYYHLTDPVRAFNQIGKVLAADGQVFFEGECLRIYAETLDGRGVQDELVAQIAASEMPLALCCPGEYKRSPNWFIPNFACLSGWFKVAGMQIISHRFQEQPKAAKPQQRITGVAAKVSSSLAISAARQFHRTIVLNGSGFCERTVLNLFLLRGGTVVNLGGLEPTGRVRLPITLDSPGQLRFELPAEVEAGDITVEACNPPYGGSERVIYKFRVTSDQAG